MRLTRVIAIYSLVLIASFHPLGSEANAAAACLPGFVWRNAFSGDAVCVTPQMRQQVADDNARAAARREPNGGHSGPQTCINGFVWRLAAPSDRVCVTPEMREQTARDNAGSASRALGNVPAMTAGYRTGNWSNWTPADGVSYRYRWGWDATNPAYGKRIDATFEIRNQGVKPWKGSARTMVCHSSGIGASKDVALAARETREIRFSTDNCGSLAEPFYRGSVVMSHTF